MNSVITFLRRRPFQPMWEFLHRVSLVLMNHWASDLHSSGEIDAVREMAVSFSPAPVLVDVGANVGDFVEVLLAHCGSFSTIHAFEPSMAAFSAMKGKFAVEHRVRLNRLALSDQPGQRKLHADAFGSSIASLEQLDRPIRPFDPACDEWVECTTLDNYCNAKGIDRIDYLKIDVEGHEMAVLNGAKRMLGKGLIDVIHWEFGENNVSSRNYLRDFVQLLDAYDHFRVVPGGVVPWRYCGGTSEIFATMSYLAVRKRRGAGLERGADNE